MKITKKLGIIGLSLAISNGFILNAQATDNVNQNDKNQSASRSNSSSIAPMLEKVMPSVVNISVRGSMPPKKIPIIDQNQEKRDVEITPKFEEFGSGVIVDAEHGYILTNAHVIRDGQVVIVTLKDGKRHHAKIIAHDEASDIAILQINSKKLQQVTFGDSDKMRIGDFVSAIGSPFGLQQTVTSGVVSGLERSNLGIEGYENFIQTDAPINPGNSGGALLNMQGELIGINTAIITPKKVAGNVGIGLAIPSNMAYAIMVQLIKYGKVERGVVGVVVQDVTPALAEAMNLPNAEGALVSQVIDGTPASDAGFMAKDVVIEVNGKKIHSGTQVRNIISLERVGTKISSKVLRNGKVVTIDVTTVSPEKLDQAEKNKQKPLLTGLMLQNFKLLVDNQLIEGVQVTSVDDNSIAFSCGLRAGDVITAISDQKVNNIEELQNVAKKHPQQMLLKVSRSKDETIFLVVEE